MEFWFWTSARAGVAAKICLCSDGDSSRLVRSAGFAFSNKGPPVFLNPLRKMYLFASVAVEFTAYREHNAFKLAARPSCFRRAAPAFRLVVPYVEEV